MSARITSGRRTMPVPQWPEVDQAGWRLANQPQDFLDDSVGYAQRWRPATRKLTQEGYGYWLDWMARSGQLSLSSHPAERATPECLCAYREAMEADGLASYTVAGRIQQVGNALSAIAPETDWAWMLRVGSRLRSKATPTRDKRVGMQPAADVKKLGFDIMHAAEHDRFRAKVERAVLFRDGLLLAMLVVRSVRRANITSIEIGRQLQRRGEDWWLRFTAGEMKSGRPFECSVPVELTIPLNRYIEVYRPTLIQCTRKAAAPTNALWISKQGTHMTSSAVYYQITARTQEEFGTLINPHKFRHIYATDTATLTPSHAGSIQSGLGHAGPEVAEKYYNLAEMVEAGRRYDETIDNLRKECRRARAHRPKAMIPPTQRTAANTEASTMKGSPLPCYEVGPSLKQQIWMYLRLIQHRLEGLFFFFSFSSSDMKSGSGFLPPDRPCDRSHRVGRYHKSVAVGRAETAPPAADAPVIPVE